MSSSLASFPPPSLAALNASLIPPGPTLHLYRLPYSYTSRTVEKLSPSKETELNAKLSPIPTSLPLNLPRSSPLEARREKLPNSRHSHIPLLHL